jgi:hypothetical protein
MLITQSALYRVALFGLAAAVAIACGAEAIIIAGA